MSITLKILCFRLFYDEPAVIGRWRFFFDSLAALALATMWVILSKIKEKISDFLFDAFFCCFLLVLAKHFGGMRRKH